jgi:hypothetical protein
MAVTGAPRIRRACPTPVYDQPVTSEVIPDRATAYGERVRRRLTDETSIWLTTTGWDGTPQPNPVGFLWDGGDSVLTYSQADARRLANIRRQPRGPEPGRVL